MWKKENDCGEDGVKNVVANGENANLSILLPEKTYKCNYKV